MTVSPVVTAVGVSPDGNYAVLGCADGALHRFALQSQGHRGAFRSLDGAVAHGAPVCGVAITEAQQVVSAATGERALKLWALGGSQQLDGQVQLGSATAQSSSGSSSGGVQFFRRQNNLVAV